jgi:thiol-disulfide isomerase/thioredoxin
MTHSPKRFRLMTRIVLSTFAAGLGLASWFLATFERQPFPLPDDARVILVSHTQQDRTLPANALDGGVAWLNTRGPIHLDQLRGKIVLLDFWTYCCINCHHVLPDLARLEAKYPNELVVIGVHSPKFPAEKDTENIRKKIAEYAIKHPVINDANQTIWNNFGVRSWPTLVLIDAKNRYVGFVAGEGNYEVLDKKIAELVAEHRANGELNPTPLKFEPEDEKSHNEALRYPGKILADAAGGRLFVSDTGHNRIVITDLDGKLIAAAGNGAVGQKNGPFEQANFNRPQGMCLIGPDTLLVADTENHMIRALDLKARTVSTVAGTGKQAPFRARGGPVKSSPISSPWDVLPDPSNQDLVYIAMAGPHQIWRLDLAAGKVELWAGSGYENITDGSRANAAFAQPSGLATDGEFLYVADSEVSGVRRVALKQDRVETVVGVDLFGFGDVDGVGPKVRLQHCLGLAYGDGKLYIADTYNNKIKVCDPKAKSVHTFVGAREPGDTDDPPRFDEPGGLSLAGNTLYVADTNNHAVRAIDVRTKAVRTLALDGVAPPNPPKRPPTFPNALAIQAPAVKVRPGQEFGLEVALSLPEGYKLNPDAPMPYLVEAPGQEGLLGPGALPSGGRVDPPSETFAVSVPLAKPAEAGQTIRLKLSVAAFLCRETLCEIHSYVWEVPVTFAEGGTDRVALSNAEARTARASGR